MYCWISWSLSSIGRSYGTGFVGRSSEICGGVYGAYVGAGGVYVGAGGASGVYGVGAE